MVGDDDVNPDCLAGGNQAWQSLGGLTQSLQWEGGESLASGARPLRKETWRQTAVGTQRPGKIAISLLIHLKVGLIFHSERSVSLQRMEM